MKRYLVFSWEDEFPSGGWDDFLIDCSTPEEATETGKNHIYSKFHVVDSETKKIIVIGIHNSWYNTSINNEWEMTSI